MPSQAFALPILPGKLDDWWSFTRTMLDKRRSEYQQSRERLGISREMAWHQRTPAGDLALIFWEGDEPEQILQRIAVSSDPFDIWFREQMLHIHGLDFAQPPSQPPAQRVIDWLRL